MPEHLYHITRCHIPESYHLQHQIWLRLFTFSSIPLHEAKNMVATVSSHNNSWFSSSDIPNLILVCGHMQQIEKHWHNLRIKNFHQQGQTTWLAVTVLATRHMNVFVWTYIAQECLTTEKDNESLATTACESPVRPNWLSTKQLKNSCTVKLKFSAGSKK